MIDKRELRIGNIVSCATDEDDNCLPCKIFELYEDRLKWGLLDDLKGGNSTSYKHTVAIRITPSWLEKMGFEQDIDEDKDVFWGIGMAKWFRLFWWEFSIPDDNGFYFKNDSPVETKVTSVHQLMNLYFFITGEELTIKTDLYER